MESLKKRKSIHLSTTQEKYDKLKKLADSYNLPLGQFLFDSALNNSNINPLYTKQVHDFMLHLESVQKVLAKDVHTDSDTYNLYKELYQEAKELWHTLNM